MEIINTNLNKEDKKAIYYMTMAPQRARLLDMKDKDIMVCDWITYTDSNNKGEEQTMLSISDDAGTVYTTISTSIIREFTRIVDLFGVPVKIHIFGGVAKSGREFISCTLAE